MNYLTREIVFPNVATTTEDGLLAVGGDLSSQRLIEAYKHGIFPWFENEEPILWWSPDPRFVLFPEKLKISKSMKQILYNGDYIVTKNKAFEDVIKQCANTKREGQSGTWISKSMIKAYIRLHEFGYAKSVEVWKQDTLVAGLYGVDLGNDVFCGESMFTTEPNASKVGFISFIENSNYKLIDCQVYTRHLESLGAEEIPRDRFLKLLNDKNHI